VLRQAEGCDGRNSNMYWSDLLAAFALYLVLEGVLPFLSPAGWRKSLLMLSQFKDGQLRFFGFASIVAGLGLLLLVRSGS
jgi:uncharacterized protein YjeT (DUF2065 family)